MDAFDQRSKACEEGEGATSDPSIEVDRLFTEERIVIEDKKRSVSSFKPLSEKMEEWLEFQWKFIGDKENS
jgi:hypothetical protein